LYFFNYIFFYFVLKNKKMPRKSRSPRRKTSRRKTSPHKKTSRRKSRSPRKTKSPCKYLLKNDCLSKDICGWKNDHCYKKRVRFEQPLVLPNITSIPTENIQINLADRPSRGPSFYKYRKPCPEGSYRHPDTNRCRKYKSISPQRRQQKQLSPCRPLNKEECDNNDICAWRKRTGCFKRRGSSIKKMNQIVSPSLEQLNMRLNNLKVQSPIRAPLQIPQAPKIPLLIPQAPPLQKKAQIASPVQQRSPQVPSIADLQARKAQLKKVEASPVQQRSPQVPSIADLQARKEQLKQVQKSQLSFADELYNRIARFTQDVDEDEF